MRKFLMTIVLCFVCTMSGCTWYESFSGCGIIEYHSCGYDSNYNFWYYVTIKDDYGNIRKIRVTEYTWYTTNVGDYVCFD